MDGRFRGGDQAGNLGGAPQRVDNGFGLMFHADTNAIIAQQSQPQKCDIRFCVSGLDVGKGGMDINRVKNWLDEIGKTQADLARALGLSPDKISKTMGGVRRFTADEALRIKAMMEDGSLLGEAGDQAVPGSELTYVRQVDISFSMGDGAIIDDYPDAGLIPFSLDFIRSVTRSSTDHLFVATGHGESMEPTLLRSDLLMIDSAQNRVAYQDQIWAISYAGCGMIKRIRRRRGLDGDEIEIISDNPVVPPQIVPLEDVHIVGKLVWVGRRM